MEMAGIFGVVWSISVLSFLYSNSLSIPPFINPLALVIVMIIFLCNPFKVFRWEARFWLLRKIVRYFFLLVSNFESNFMFLLLFRVG